MALAAASSFLGQFPLTTYTTAQGVTGGLALSLLGCKVGQNKNKALMGLFDATVAGLQMVATNVVCIGTAEALANYYGIESTYLNQVLIAGVGYAIALPLYSITLELPPTQTGTVLKASVRFLVTYRFGTNATS